MITQTVRKALDIKPSGRSSDYITPSFIHGCLFKCGYCYMRRNKPEGISIATNIDEILQTVYNHAQTLGVKIPNQTHENLWTYDISCNEDFALHAKYHDWEKIFDFFTQSDLPIMGTFATKYVNDKLLDYNPDKKIRIRFSLMPQSLSDILEPNTSLISERIEAINDFYYAGYDVHINFSPIIIIPGAKSLYEDLFKKIDYYVDDKIKNDILAECIMLTHNKGMHEYNLEHNPEVEELLWNPEIQEDKTSSYGSKNIRYKWQLKNKYISDFVKLHDEIIPWNKIRYIF
jgi:spore photoproduct lyase